MVFSNANQNSACHIGSCAFNDVKSRSGCCNRSVVNIRGSVPYIRRFQDAGFDVQLFGFGLHEQLHNEDEHCLLNDMRKGYQVLISIIKFTEERSRDNGEPHQYVSRVSAVPPLHDPTGYRHEADDCTGQLVPDTPAQDTHVQKMLMQVPLMHQQFAQDQFTLELVVQELTQEPCKQENVQQDTVKAKPSSSFQALPGRGECLPGKRGPCHKVRHQRSSMRIAYSRSCQGGFFSSSKICHPRYSVKKKADEYEADISDNTLSELSAAKRCLNVNAIVQQL